MMNSIRNNREVVRFIRFGIVGAIGAIVDFAVLNLLIQVFKVPFILSSIISFIFAFISNFIWNRLWTYPDSRSKKVSHQFTLFALISVVGLLIRTPLLAFLEGRLTSFFTTQLVLPWMTPITWAHNIALAIAIFVVMLWNYFANRYLTYNDVK